MVSRGCCLCKFSFYFHFIFSGEKVAPCICPGATDIRFVRSLGIPGLGFMPIKNTPILLHDHDEFLGAEMYLRGIEIYQKILENITQLD